MCFTHSYKLPIYIKIWAKIWDCRVPLFLFLLPCYLFYWYGLPLEKSLLYFVAFFLYQSIKIKLSFWVFTSILFIAIEHILNGSWRSQNYIIKRMKMIWPLFSIRFLHLLLNILWKSFTIMIKIIFCPIRTPLKLSFL